MEDSELEALLRDLESDRVERKSSLADGERIREAICAFANALTHPGQPGISSSARADDGRAAGLPITDDLLLKIAAMRDDGNIQPLPSLTVEKRRLAGGEMAVATVQPALAPPVRLRGRTWIRVGPRRALATPDEERRLAERRRHSDLPFELRPASGRECSPISISSCSARSTYPAWWRRTCWRRTREPSSISCDPCVSSTPKERRPTSG